MILLRIWLLFISYVCFFLLRVQSSFIPTNLKEDDFQRKGELHFVHVLFRHGDRNPIQQNPGDKYNISYWSEGWGQLTNLGKKQHFELGKWLRLRYKNFLSDQFNVDDIYVQSSDVDRTLMSASANLAGLYPPEDNQIWKPFLRWQPIPIHTTPLTTDYLIGGQVPLCPSYQKAYKDYLQSDEMKEIEGKMKPFYDIISANTGVKINSTLSLLFFRDSWLCESIHKLPLPEWTKQLFPNNEKFYKAAMTYYYTTSATKYLAKYSSGFLLKDMLDRFTNKTENKLTPDRKFWMYSSHDSTLFSFLNSLDISDNKYVPYAGTILLELRYYKNEYYVQIFYKNSDKTPNPINIPGCGIACPLSRMYEIYNSVIPKHDFNTECQIDE